MTATEVNVRYELMQRLLGPTLGRLQNDLLDPLVQRTFNIMFRAQQLPELPEGLEVSELDIEYTGPLPRAQKMETSQAINTWIADIGQMAQIYPDALDLVDVDEAVRISAQLRGVPAKAMKSEDQIKEDRKARKEQQQSAAGVEAARTTGEAAKAVGEGMDAMGVEDKQGALVQLQGGGAA